MWIRKRMLGPGRAWIISMNVYNAIITLWWANFCCLHQINTRNLWFQSKYLLLLFQRVVCVKNNAHWMWASQCDTWNFNVLLRCNDISWIQYVVWCDQDRLTGTFEKVDPGQATMSVDCTIVNVVLKFGPRRSLYITVRINVIWPR